MSIESGQYLIIAKDGSQLNRSPIEDRSLLPKDLYLLRPDVGGLPPVALQQDGDGYKMKALGSDVGFNDRTDSVAAFLLPDMGGGASKMTFKSASGGYKIGVNGRYITKGDERGMGYLVRLGSEGEALVFDAVHIRDGVKGHKGQDSY